MRVLNGEPGATFYPVGCMSLSAPTRRKASLVVSLSPQPPKDVGGKYTEFQGSDPVRGRLGLIPPDRAGSLSGYPSLNWRVQWKFGNPLLSGALERQIFFGKGNGVALSTRQTIFLVPSQGWGEKRKRERKGN